MVEDQSHHIVIKLLNDCDEPVWTPKLLHYLPQIIPADRVKSFG